LIHTVYITTNLDSGKFYIGKHTKKKPVDSYVGSGVWVNKCKKSGLDLKCDVIASCQTEKDAYAFERVLVSAAKSQHPDLCMNFMDGGRGYPTGHNKGRPGNMLGKRHSEETKRKIGQKSKGRKLGERHHFWGKKLSKETREKMSNSHKKIAHLRGKKVLCIEENIIFNSLVEAALFAANDKRARSNIRLCCNGKIRYAYGYTWKLI